MDFPIRQSTATVIPLGFFLSKTDGDTEQTSLSLANTDLWVWKAGATSLISKNSGGATHMQNGVFYATLDTTDTNTVGPFAIYIHKSGALVCVFRGVVLRPSVYDALYGSSAGYLPVDVEQWKGSAAPNLTGDPYEEAVSIKSVVDATKTVVDAIKVVVDATKTVADAVRVVTDRLGGMIELDGAVYRFTLNALEQGPTGSGSSPEEVAVAVLAASVGTGGATVEEVLRVARAAAVGKFVQVSTDTYQLYDADGVTVVATYSIDATGRTPE